MVNRVALEAEASNVTHTAVYDGLFRLMDNRLQLSGFTALTINREEKPLKKQLGKQTWFDESSPKTRAGSGLMMGVTGMLVQKRGLSRCIRSLVERIVCVLATLDRLSSLTHNFGMLDAISIPKSGLQAALMSARLVRRRVMFGVDSKERSRKLLSVTRPI